MIYKNPLHIISDKDLTEVSPVNLKRWRKEVMLQFKLTNETTIKLNGREYDKQGVKDAFAELEEGFAFHLELFNNELLLAFLEEGDLSFFDSENPQETLLNSNFKTRLSLLFSQAYGHVIEKAIKNQTNDNIFRLSKINNSGIVSKITTEEGLAAAFGRFKYFVDNFSDISQELLVDTNSRELHPEIANYINPYTKKLLSQLPNAFQELKSEFARLIVNNFLRQTISNDRILKLRDYYDISALQTLLTAVQIVKNIEKFPQALLLIKLISEAISDTKLNVRSKSINYSGNPQPWDTTKENNRNKQSERSNFTIFKFALFFVILVFGAMNERKAFSGCNFLTKPKMSRYDQNRLSRRNTFNQKNDIGQTNTTLDIWKKSLTADNLYFTFYVDEKAQYWMVEYEGRKYEVAKIINVENKKYLKPFYFSNNFAEKNRFSGKNIYFFKDDIYCIDMHSEKRFEPLIVRYHPKEDFFSVVE